MKIVKLTFNYDFPVFRQTPGGEGVWGDYKFVIDDNLEECDWWVVYTDYRLRPETCRCNPENIIFMPAEGYNTSAKYFQKFLDQFGMIVTVQRELQHHNLLHMHNANPWFVGKSYDELIALTPPKKTKSISFIASDKAYTEGHRKRLKFMEDLQKHFGDEIDFYGKGIRPFEDKWDVLAPYKYSIITENDYCPDWVTEKFFDSIFAFSYPIYYGCPNLADYLEEDCYTAIDINDSVASIRTIRNCIANDAFEKKLEALSRERIHSLNNNNLFPLLARIMDRFNPQGRKKKVTLKLNTNAINRPGFIKRVQRRLTRLVSS